MNDPSKHHFSPAFSMEPWTGADGRICQMRRINGIIVPKRWHPNATGFEKDLYRTEGVPADQAQHLEKHLMSPLDDVASKVLAKMLAGDPQAVATTAQRSGWVRYILSLMFRNPDTAKDIKAHMVNVWVSELAYIREHYDAWRKPSDPPTFEEFEKLLDPAAPHISATNMLIGIIDNTRVGPNIFDMHWSVIRISESSVPLMTSDHPLDRPFGLSDPRAYIAFPIAPYAFFLAANDLHLGHVAGQRPHTELAKKLNKAVVAQASEFVWARDDSQIDFVRKWFGKAPVGSAITAAQKDASLNASRAA